MEKIVWTDLPEEELASWVLIEALARHVGFFRAAKEKGVCTNNLEAVLTINGIEVPFMKTMDFLQSQIDQMVAEKAEAVINDMSNTTQEELGDAFKAFTTKVYDKLGVKREEAW